jgi:3-hydroxyisobutyrate dehydrogenase
MLGYPNDVRRMVLGEEGILKSMRPNTYLIDHTTSSPDLAKEIYFMAKKYGVRSLDAPVSGGDIGAKNGSLVTMVGGDA